MDMRSSGVKRWSAWTAAVGLGLGLVGASLTVSTAAVADTPDAPVLVAFDAPPCVGTTVDDPSDASGPVENLRLVFGDRLDAYNLGEIVPLYDAFGTNDEDALGGGYPPVCGVHYDGSVGGPVSEWMFCTDYTSLVCSGVNAAGQLVDKDGNVLTWPGELPGNSKLDADVEKLIVALINGSWPYAGTGYFDFDGTTVARADGNSNERAALQILVWCLTDPPAGGDATEQDRVTTCADSMSVPTQEAILASVPDDPSLSLDVESPSIGLEVGTEATFVLDTNVLNSAIELTLVGPAADLAVVGGSATLSGSTLTVTGSGPVRLAVTGTGAGEVDLIATVDALGQEQLSWHQATHVSAVDPDPCQVFATMFGSPITITAAEGASFVEAPTSPTKPVSVETAAR